MLFQADGADAAPGVRPASDGAVKGRRIRPLQVQVQVQWKQSQNIDACKI